jgi:hypothetical protein
MNALQLGSLTALVDCADARHRDMLQRIFRNPLTQARHGTAPDLRIQVTSTASGLAASCDRSRHDYEVHSEYIRAALTTGTPPCIDVRIAPEAPDAENFMYVVFNSMLRRLGVLRLHGAACRYRGRTHVWLGPSGAGKSTVSVLVGRAGGVVLSEDQLLLKTRPLRISGSDGRLRLTAKSQSFFFPQRTDEELAAGERLAKEDGDHKRELLLDGLVPNEPYRDHIPDRLYFTRVGERLACAPLPPRAVVGRLLADLSTQHRFTSANERVEFLDVLTELARVPAWDVELSPRLDELPALLDWLA